MECDTAGAGEYRGGAGIKYAFQNYDDGSEIVMYGDGVKIAPYGLNGGSTGSLQVPLVRQDGEWIQTESKEYPRKISDGDIVYIHSAGGGGYGNPYKRDVKRVHEDYLDGIISRESALNDYGVKINEDDKVDMDATSKIRGI